MTAVQHELCVWLDGELYRDAATATVPVNTHSLHYGTAVFEGIRAYGDHLFRGLEHFRRFDRSARILGYELPYSAATLHRTTQDLIDGLQLPGLYVRPLAWLGSGGLGVSRGLNRPHVAISFLDWPDLFPDRAGLRLKTSTLRRPGGDLAPVRAKASALYAIGYLARTEAEAVGFDDALMLDQYGNVAETSGANVFVRFGDRIVTPPTHSALDGITRQVVMELLAAAGEDLTVSDIHPSALADADEVFLTGTAYEIQPVVAVDGLEFASGTTTKTLQSAYARLTGAPA